MHGSEPAAFALLVFTSMLAIVNPLSAVPLFLTMTGTLTPPQRRATLRLAIATSIIVLCVFGLLGTWILQFFGITTDAFRITGGLLFLGIGSDMLQAKRSRDTTTSSEEEEAEQRNEIGIIPLGIPTLAGPGALTTVITLATQADTVWKRGAVYAGIVVVMLVSWLVLSVAPALFRRLGRTGLNVMTRIMGLIVMVIGTQFIIDGVRVVVLGIMRSR
jgi:multiple antibiotic resistance protein